MIIFLDGVTFHYILYVKIIEICEPTFFMYNIWSTTSVPTVLSSFAEWQKIDETEQLFMQIQCQTSVQSFPKLFNQYPTLVFLGKKKEINL